MINGLYFVRGNMFMKQKILIAQAFLLLLVVGCKSANEEELYPRTALNNCDTTKSTWNTGVATLMTEKCVNCHPDGSVPDFSTYESTILYGAKIKERINLAATDTRVMPQNNKMDVCRVDQITRWVDKGMPR
jgi:hypothetical protein